MRIVLLALSLFLCLPALVHADTFVAASCSLEDIEDAIALASHGDTVRVPIGTCDFTSTLTISKGISLLGGGCAVDEDDNAVVPCLTVLRDAYVSSSPIIVINKIDGYTTEVTGFSFVDNGGSQKNNGVIIVQPNVTGGRVNIHHNAATNLNGVFLFTKDALGVIHHNTILYDTAIIPIYGYHSNWGGYTSADGSWADTNGFGSEEFLFIERNHIEFTDGAKYAAIDAYRGTRFVVRYNTLINTWVECHGTDSGGRERGCRAFEVYENDFICTVTCDYVINDRSGVFRAWGNTTTGFTNPHMTMAVYRTFFPFDPFYMADGKSPWDVNVGGGPFESGTATAGSGEFLLVDSSQSWDTNEWAGYTLKLDVADCMTFGASPWDWYCSSLIVSNTSDTLTLHDDGAFASGQPGGYDPLTVDSGAAYEIWKVSEALDQPGRSGGTRLLRQTVSSLTSVGLVGTVTTSSAHGYMTGDCVGINVPEYTYTYSNITVTGETTFTIDLPGEIGVAGSAGYSVTKAPGCVNDQVDDPIYQWLNTETEDDSPFFLNSNMIAQIRPNEHYFDHEPAKTFDGTIASNRSSVGVGTLAARPATCTTGVFYWATDQGSWNRTGADGLGYRCTAMDTWALDYTPYVYPHPLTLNEDLTNNLISYWELEEASGTRNDSTSSANHLTDNNTVTQAAGIVGDAAVFARGNLESLSRVSNASLVTGDIDFTIAAWVYITAQDQTAVFVTKSNGTSEWEYDLFFSFATGQAKWYVESATDTSEVFCSADAITASTWAFIVAWHDATNDIIGCSMNDGTPLTGAHTTGARSTSHPLYMGTEGDGSTTPYSGRMDQVGFWKEVLSEDEITWLFNGGAGRSYSDVAASAGTAGNFLMPLMGGGGLVGDGGLVR